MTQSSFAALGMLVLGSLLAACSSPADQRSAHTPQPPAPLTPPALSQPTPVDLPGIHNVVAYHQGLYSGSAPEGEPGFESLAAMGVKTIVSVDGAEPDLTLARANGLRYIHLPIGYNGFDEQRRIELTRAVRDAMQDGSVYVHCHHGKHRSAGAAGAVVVSLGLATPEQMVDRMKVSGTAPSYTGLYRCTSQATVLPPAVIDAIDGDFPEVSRPQGMVKSMVEIDEAAENLKAVEKAGWVTPPDHPDLVPVAEAARLADLLRLLDSSPATQSKPPEFAQWMRDSAAQAQSLEDMLAANEPDRSKISGQYALIVASCKHCHAAYRD